MSTQTDLGFDRAFVLEAGEREIPAGEKREWFDRLRAAAKAQAPWLPDEWEWHSWDARKKGLVKLVGGVPRFPDRNADDRWKGVAETTLTLTDAEVNAAVARYIAETGNCAECSGTGWRFARVGHYADGVHSTERVCRTCDGTGRANRELGAA